MSVSEIKLYKILKEKMGEDEAQSLVEYVESKIEAEFHDKQYVLATKQDLQVLKEELVERMDKKFDSVDSRFERIEHKFNDLKIQVKADKSDTIKWMFIFWAGQLAAMFALFKFFIP